MLCVALLFAWTALAHSEDSALDVFCPADFVDVYNQTMPIILEKRYGETLSEEALREMTEALHLSFTETTDDGLVFYNNSTWAIELSGMYQDRTAKPFTRADTLTFSVTSDIIKALKDEICFALAFTIWYCEQSFEFYDLLEGLNGIDLKETSHGSVELGHFLVTVLSLEGRCYYALTQVHP